MDGRRRFAGVALLIMTVTAAAPAQTYRLVVNGEELEFVAAPERGYVVKLAERTGRAEHARSHLRTLYDGEPRCLDRRATGADDG